MIYYKNMKVPYFLSKLENWDKVINDLIPPDSFQPLNLKEYKNLIDTVY